MDEVCCCCSVHANDHHDGMPAKAVIRGVRLLALCSPKVALAPQTWCNWLVGGKWPRHRKKNHCHRTLSKKVISNSGFSLIDFCQKNCNSMGMAHALADHVFFISTNQMQPRCLSCVEFNGGFRGWPPFLAILNPLQAVAKSKCGKLPFSIIATTWQDVICCSRPKPHVTALKPSAIKPAWQDLSDDMP